jgi:hypothetical protein
MQTLVRVVVVLVIVLLLLVVALPLQLVNMLAENESKPADDLEGEPASTTPARAAAASADAQPRIRSEAINTR